MKRHLLLSISLAFILLLSGQAMACLSPSMQEMREDRSMACCAEHCGLETNSQAAKKACEQTRQALIQPEVLSGSPSAAAVEAVKFLPGPALFLPMDLATRNQIHSTLQTKEHDLSKRFISVEIYTLIHSLLI